jgi:histidinol-phosphate aminotransferase
MTRRDFGRRTGMLAAGVAAWTETALAQRAAIAGQAPKDTIWLNANENPDGPPPAAVEAAVAMVSKAGRYGYQQFRDIYAEIARSEGLNADQVVVGAGSSEILHCAIDAFTSPERPLITMDPTYEMPAGLTRFKGHKVVRVALNDHYAADVKLLVEEAGKAGGGLIFICNPNNPTSAVTPKKDIDWLVANLPPNTIALIDEAYIHLSDSPELESAIKYVKQGKDVVVSRTFSKIYGMAGLRVGFSCARPDLTQKMEPYRDNVISIVSAHAALAALADTKVVPERRAKIGKVRSDLCAWLRTKNVKYIEPHANFIMIETGRDARTMQREMLTRGVAVGRAFPPLEKMMRVSIGTAEDMEKFRRVFWEVMSA